MSGVACYVSQDTRVEETESLSAEQKSCAVGAGGICQLIDGHWRSCPLAPVAASCVAGVLIDSGVPVGVISPLSWMGIWIVAGTLLAAPVLLPMRSGSVLRSVALQRCALSCLFLTIGGAAHRFSDIQYDHAAIQSLISNGQQSNRQRPAIIEGTIDRTCVLRRNAFSHHRGKPRWQTIVELRLKRLRLGHQFQPCNGRLLMEVGGRAGDLYPGDVVRASGTLRGVRRPSNPGTADLRKSYRRRGLHGTISVDSIIHVKVIDREGSPVGRLIARAANDARDQLLHWMGPDAGPLAVALVVGQRGVVDDATRDRLLVTGTAHLLSVSGLHLAIVVLLARWLTILCRFPRSASLLTALMVCMIYTAITGARPPVVRAAILVSALLLASWIRRPTQPMNTLSLAALLLILHNPELVFSVGVHLSFLAVATLLSCGRRDAMHPASLRAELDREQRLTELIRGTQSRLRRVVHTFVASAAQLAWFSGCVTVMSLPLVWYHFHVISFVSVLSNVILAPVLFVALASGIALVLVAWIGGPFVVLISGICRSSLHVIQAVIDCGSQIPLGHFWLPSPPLWLVVLFYAVMASSFLVPRGPRISIARYVWIMTWLLSAAFVARQPTSMEQATIEATFIDVGHGTSVVIRLGPDDVWLYDCGRMGNEQHSSRGIDTTLWSMGVTRIRGVFLSHADADHFNALPGLARRFTIEQVLTPKGMLNEQEVALDAIREAIEEQKLPVCELWSGCAIRSSGRSIDVLHPPMKRVAGNDNANSLVIRIQSGGKTILLPGDLEQPGIDHLINQPRPSVGGLLMAPHHGSLTVDAASVLRWARPRETVVSGGRRAGRPAVTEMLAATGSTIHTTTLVGAIRVRIDENGTIRVRRWLESPW